MFKRERRIERAKARVLARLAGGPIPSDTKLTAWEGLALRELVQEGRVIRTPVPWSAETGYAMIALAPVTL